MLKLMGIEITGRKYLIKQESFYLGYKKVKIFRNKLDFKRFLV